MRVVILSGNQAGQIVDLPRIEAEVALQTGYATLAPESPPLVVAKVQAAEKPTEAKPKAHR